MRVDDDVVAGRQVHVEADAKLDEWRQSSRDRYAAAVDAVDAGDALEQRALAAAVAPDDPEELAGCDLQRDVLDGVELVVLGAAERV